MLDESSARGFSILYAGGAVGSGFSKNSFCRGTAAVKGGYHG